MFSNKDLEEKSNYMEAAVTPEKVLGFLNGVLPTKYNPKVLDGCIYCFENMPNLCADIGKISKEESVLAEPANGMEKPLAFPIKCLSECFGDRLLFCENCKVAFPAEPNSTCKYCGKTLSPFKSKVSLKKIMYHNVDYDEKKYAYTHDPNYADWDGFDRCERAFLETGGSLYAVDFGIKRGCEYCIEKYGKCEKCREFCLDGEHFVEFPVGDKVYIEEVPCECATTAGVGKSLCKHCGIVIENEQERCPLCFRNTYPISRLNEEITNRKMSDCEAFSSSTKPLNDYNADGEYMFYNNFTDEVVSMAGCKECVKKYGGCADIEYFAKHRLIYTDPFGKLPQGVLLPDYCVYKIDDCQRYCEECGQATTEEIEICPLCGGDMREFF